jgi:hypothetical protein
VVDIDPEDLAEERVERLAVPERVSAAPTIAERDVQVAVGPKTSAPPLWLGNGCLTNRSRCSEAGFRRSGLAGSTRNADTRVSPFLSV